MPVIIHELPFLDKLPPKLYGGNFDLLSVPDQNTAIYIFHDKTWFANLQHMLGWSREIIHSLKSTWMQNLFGGGRALRPDWLCGHAFQRVENNITYRISGREGSIVQVNTLIEWASEAQTALEGADIHTDQWGSKTHEGWKDAIRTNLDNKNHPLIQEIRKARSDLEVHTMLANHGNATHHPQYPAKGE
jgi:hypothetical protein